MILTTHNFSIIHLIVKLNDCNVDLFKIKHVFKNNFLIIELNHSTFMKIHSIFYIILLNYITSNFLSSQYQKSWEFIIVKNDERFWYVNSILNFKHDKHYNSSLLKYYIDWKDHFFTWKSFHLLNNCEQAFNEYYLVNFVVEESHVLSCMIFQCQYQEL